MPEDRFGARRRERLRRGDRSWRCLPPSTVTSAAALSAVILATAQDVDVPLTVNSRPFVVERGVANDLPVVTPRSILTGGIG